MPLDSRIHELLSRWEQACREGRDVSAEELCKDQPELFAEVRGQIDSLRAWNQNLDRVRLAADAVAPFPPSAPAEVDPSPTRVGPWEAPPLAAAPSAATPPTTKIRCPHCHNPIQLGKESDEVLCPGCGSSFRLRDARHTDTTSGMKSLGKFQLLERLGLGGFGAVWKARDTELDRIVALKIPHTGLLTDQEECERFQREARAAAQLRHPHIVIVHNVETLNGLPVIVSEFVQGVPLKDLLQVRRLTFREAAALVAQVAGALDYAHSMGVVHRDIKPANIMLARGEGRGLRDESGGVRDEGRGVREEEEASSSLAPSSSALDSPLGPRLSPLVLDFGLALREGVETTMTIDGHVLGTPAYMSPEQAAGHSHQADRRSDVYSLGVVLYELLTGELPFRGSKLMLLQQVLHDEPRAPRSVNDKVPRDLETIALKAMAKKPARRYQSARELADDLQRFLGGEPIKARPVGTVERFLLWMRRHPARAAIGFLVLMITVLGVAGGSMYWLWREADAAHQDARAAQNRSEEAAEREKAERTKAENAAQGEKTARVEAEIERGKAVEARIKAELAAKGEMKARKEAEEAFLAEKQAREELTKAQDLIARLKYASDINLAHKMALSKNWTQARALWLAGPPHLRGWEWGYVEQLFPRQRTLQGHKHVVTSVSFSPDGRRLASASLDKTVKVWDLAGGKETLSLEGHNDRVTCVSFSPDGRRLASASYDKTVKVWDLAGGKETLCLQGHKDEVTSVSFSPDGRRLASASEDETVKVWDLAGGKEALCLQGHKDTVTSVSFSPDGRRLASASHDKTVKVWDLAGGKEALCLQGHKDPVTSVSFSPDGRRLASASEDRTVKVWDLAGRKETLSLQGHKDYVTSVSFSPDGRRLASASFDRTVKVWDLAGGKETLSLEGHKDVVRSVSFSPDSRRLASASLDKTVKVWDLAGGKETLSLQGHTNWLMGLSFSPDGRRLASASWDQTVKVWDLAGGKETLSLEGHKDRVSCVSFSPDGRRLASSVDKTVKVWDLAGGKETLSLEGHKNTVTSVSFSLDNRRLASASVDKTVKVWDLAGGKETLSLEGHKKAVTSVSFSPDGRRLASASHDTTVKVWDLAGGKETLSLQGHKDWLTSVSFSPDGRRLASASHGTTVKVWDLAGGKETLSLEGHKDTVTSVSFSPDGRRLASASVDKTVKVWEALDTGPLWHLREAAASERDKDWFAAAFHLKKCIAEEKAYRAAEAAAIVLAPHALAQAASWLGVRHLEGRTDLSDLHTRHTRAQDEWKKVQKQNDEKE